MKGKEPISLPATLALVLLHFASESVLGSVRPVIVWDPRNPVFHCPSKVDQEIHVHIGDSLSFVCPHKAINIGNQASLVQTDNLYENMYLLQPNQENDYNNCDSTDTRTQSDTYLCRTICPSLDPWFTLSKACTQSFCTRSKAVVTTSVTTRWNDARKADKYFVDGGRQILLCDNPSQLKYITLTFKQFSGSSNALTFQPGKTYYMIGTGNHTYATRNNRVGGSCRGTYGTYKLRLKVKVCALNDASCNLCETCSCYTKGCGRYGSWDDTGLYRNLSTIASDSRNGNIRKLSQSAIENKCVKLRERTCDNKVDGCDGPNFDFVNTTCPKVRVLPDNEDCSTWKTSGDIYRNSTGDCFVEKSRECWIGTIERINTTEWKLEQTVCPTATVPPTRQPVACGNWTISREDLYYNMSGSCFTRYFRRCGLISGAYNFTQFQLRNSICPTTRPVTTQSATVRTTPTSKPLDCDEWNDNNDTYRNASDRCFSKQFRRCKVATNITQIQLKETPCPTNAPVTQASSTSASTQLDTSTESIVTSAQVTQATAHTPVTDTKKPCPTSGTAVDGGFTEWSQWTLCLHLTLFPKLRTRERTCTNPPPSNGGKQCVGYNRDTELCPPKKRIQKGSVRFASEPWKETYTDKTSEDYAAVVTKIETAIKNAYSGFTTFQAALETVKVTDLKPGSVIASFEIIYQTQDTNATWPLKQAVRNGNLGGLEVDRKSLSLKEGTYNAPKTGQQQIGQPKEDSTKLYVIPIVTFLVGLGIGGFLVFAYNRRQILKRCKTDCEANSHSSCSTGQEPKCTKMHMSFDNMGADIELEFTKCENDRDSGVPPSPQYETQYDKLHNDATLPRKKEIQVKEISNPDEDTSNYDKLVNDSTLPRNGFAPPTFKEDMEDDADSSEEQNEIEAEKDESGQDSDKRL